MRYLLYFFMVICPLSLLSCSTGPSGGTASSSDMALVQSVLSVEQKVENASNMYGSQISTSFWFQPALDWGQKLYATSIADEWDDTGEVSIVDPVLGGSNRVSIKGYMGKQFDSDAVNPNGAAINVFGRIDNAMKMFCGLALGITSLDSSGYPINGTYEIAISSAFATSINTECGITVNADMIDTTVNVVATTPADTTLYDKKVSMTIDSDPYILYLRYNATHINVASAEKSANGEYRTSVLYNKTTKVMRAEYISADTAGTNEPMYLYRIYSDETSNIGYIAAYESGGSSDYKVYMLSGTPDGTGNTALSFSISDAANHTGSSDAKSNLNACVSNSGSIVTDNTLTCSGAIDIGSYPSATIHTNLMTPAVNKNDTTGWNVINEANGSIVFSTPAELFTTAFILP